ncbi:hypothetical protein IE53DRAFT_360455 [Violaceomyces palustris]|uniref:Uncharacterized protein n=1 Tax=Violaceomyces palustris TaxID=1673888 RepID=A0ACD0P485_9BASI|nr:hypothetical protein IE53DRAFT_360455 [Violaceomyces palustris]
MFHPCPPLLFLLAALVSLPHLIRAATVYTPVALFQCQNVQIKYDTAQGKPYLFAFQGKDTSAAPLVKFPAQDASSGSVTWKVNQPVGTVLTFAINDDSGQMNFSGQVTVQQGDNGDCLSDYSASSDGSSSSSTLPPSIGTSSSSTSSSGTGSSSNTAGSTGTVS